ncbi:MAG TPA: S9 family peptidase [Mycobacteriales bacterium]|nr:S9 family peptidase [Mycobacteriales bacterium]
MKPDDLALARTPSAPTLSPDGRRVVVTVTRPDLDEDEYASQLWLVSTDGSADPRPLTHGRHDGAAAFSPDGRWIAFTRGGKDSKPQIHVMAADGGESRAVTDHPLGAGAPVWSPDSDRIAYTARVPEDGRYGTDEDRGPGKEAPRRITTFQYHVDGLGYTNDRREHVFVVDPFTDGAEPVQVTDGDYDDSDVTWSPAGGLLAFASSRHASRDSDLRSDLFVVAPDGSQLKQVTGTSLSVAAPRFSADGRTLFFAGSDFGPDGIAFFAMNTGLFAIPVEGGVARRLTDAENVDIDAPATVHLLGADLLVPVLNRGAVDLRRFGADGSERDAVIAGPRQVRGFDVAGDAVIAVVGDAGSAGEVVLVRDGTEEVLTDFGAPMREGGELRPLQELTAQAPDGYPVHGWLVEPAGPGPHPVLLLIHGGPYAQYGWSLFDEAQVYAGAGYAVVMGNPRGSAGYGQKHGLAIKGDVGERSAVDLFALLDAALTRPGLNAEQVGVLGGSHGGFMTSWLLGHSDRFRAGISERAVNAIDSFTGSSDIGWMFADQLYGPDPEEQRRQSPLTAAGDISAPLLIIHSENDWRCPIEQGQRLYVALKSRGAEVEMLLFPGEGHEMSRSGLPSHRLARFAAILDWWARHLR